MVFTTGLLIQYPASIITENGSACVVGGTISLEGPRSTTELMAGMRMPNFTVLNQSDGVPAELSDLLRANGRFRLLVFIGDISQSTPFACLQQLATQLSSSSSFLRRFTPAEGAIDSRVEILTIHAAPRSQVELLELPDILHPWSKELGWDYWKVYADDKDVHGNPSDAYSRCGIDPSIGSLAVVRPDGYVGLVCPLEELENVEAYFARFLPDIN
ncbi:MAG: hypothetical protein Q9219_006100 [cf. Caloplaca sp. 3 TL-2023]